MFVSALASRPAPIKTSISRRSGLRLLRGLGGGRYAVATVVSALGGGLIRPFLLLYAVTVSHVHAGQAGLALSLGFMIGLAAVPIAGRCVDAGACQALVVVTLAFRGAGLLALLLVPGPAGFLTCCVLQGIGNQCGPVGQAGVVASFTAGRERDTVLAALRSLANAGLGAGALLATAAISTGDVGLQWLAGGTAAGYLASAVLVIGAGVGPGVSSRRASLEPARPVDRPILRRLVLLNLFNLPFAFCFDILEVALPIVLVTQMRANSAWSSGIFVGNTVMVVVLQIPIVRWLSRRSRRRGFALSGWVLSASYLGFLFVGRAHGNDGAAALMFISVAYSLGEIAYTGTGTALVIHSCPPHLRGRALARWQLSLGCGRAMAPFLITIALASSAAALWLPLAAATLAAAFLISRRAPREIESSSDTGSAAIDSRPDTSAGSHEQRPVVAGVLATPTPGHGPVGPRPFR